MRSDFLHDDASHDKQVCEYAYEHQNRICDQQLPEDGYRNTADSIRMSVTSFAGQALPQELGAVCQVILYR